METLLELISDEYGIAFVLAFIVFLVGIVINWKSITEWIGMIQPPEWMNALAMVIALGVIPLFYVYKRWIAAIIVILVIFTL